MNPRIIKETRALLPVFGVTLLAAIAPPLIWRRETAQVVGNIIFTICCVILGASCFGNEYQWRTMPLLLSQPVPRRKIWNEKLLVLGIGLALGLLMFLICGTKDEGSRWFAVFVCVSIPCTAPYLALKVKNTIAAAACTFFIPMALIGIISAFMAIFDRYFPSAEKSLENWLTAHSYWTQDHPYWLVIPMVIYCAVFYRLGFVNFMKLQAIDAQLREIALPARMEGFLGRQLKGLLPGYSGPWASLFRKELQLQKTSFLLAGFACIASLLCGLAWDLYPSDIFEGLAGAAIAILVFAIPLIASGICVAEERNWGVGEWQRALPMPARKQWAAKLLTVLFTNVLLGVVLPFVMWLASGWVFQLPFGPKPFYVGNVPEDALTVMLFCFLVYWLVFSLGIFSSSVSTSTVRAIIMTVGLIMAAAGVAAKVSGIALAGSHLPYGGIGAGIRHSRMMIMYPAFLLLLGLVHYVAYGNFRSGEPGARRVLVQLVLVVGLVGVAGGICSALW
jgi:hypothetical protein